MTISLTLTIGIIIAKWGYDDFNMRFWLIISIISCALGSIIFFLTEFLSQKAYFSRSHQQLFSNIILHTSLQLLFLITKSFTYLSLYPIALYCVLKITL